MGWMNIGDTGDIMYSLFRRFPLERKISNPLWAAATLVKKKKDNYTILIDRRKYLYLFL